MEQRIGTSSKPLEGAGFDPAFIPGLTAPVSGEPEDAKPGEVEEEPAAGEPADAPAAAEDSGAEEPDDGAEPDAEEVPDGPVFEAADRRARIVADHRGVRLALDDQECEFRWDEIGAVETETARFGKRFTVTVHTPDRRWYPIEIEATSRGRFKDWETALDEVLDAYFEDGEAEPEAESDAEPEAESDAGPEAKPGAQDDDAKSGAKSGAKGEPEDGAADGAKPGADADGEERKAAAAAE
ncbi:hypothetical protein [Streptomyces sp. NPDC018947]|uniref:hypothetical protein n=1 Tax=Streptomyces sp. NPDC018947 TaxID=3365054 RepID=UPI00379D06E9